MAEIYEVVIKVHWDEDLYGPPEPEDLWEDARGTLGTARNPWSPMHPIARRQVTERKVEVEDGR